MLRLLAQWGTSWFGPLRLFGSYLVLIGLGGFLAAVGTWLVLGGDFWHSWMPRDRGKALVQGGHLSAGKPTGVGLMLLLVTLPVWFLVLPFSFRLWGVVACLFLASLTGYLDDRSDRPWGEWRKGLLDLVICLACSVILCGWELVRVWLPLVKGEFFWSPWIFIPVSTAVLWFSINATNCSDGVDGLAGSLSLLSLLYLGVLLYVGVGHRDVARYLLLSHQPEGAMWALLVFTFLGTLAAYLWYNAEPSALLMGDAGSRPLGLLTGVAVVATGNPFLILVVAPILIINGGAGLVKLALLRFFRRLGFETTVEKARGPLRLLHCIRLPLHDHCRRHLGWSNAQVLMRFTLLQALLIPLLLVLLVKLR